MRLLPTAVDAIRSVSPDAVRMTGLLGERLEASRVNRFARYEDHFLLWPFQEHLPVPKQRWRLGELRRPVPVPWPELTRGDWQGEFMGTWIAAAATMALNAGDEDLRKKVDALVQDWLATQTPDGYLGTYDEDDRWESWDLWVQAHGLVGLLTYHSLFGVEEALEAARRVADRVLQDFGSGRRSVIATGSSMGMASSALLEPIVWLYWETGDSQYLDFATWLVDEDWDAPGGPAISSSLLAGRGVAGVANGKACEMLIDLAGMVDLHRATGEKRYLTPVLIAWEDIARHHLYITGSATDRERFGRYAIRNDGFGVGETCVTMTWLYLNLSLGRLTGQSQFFDAAEQALYNHLLAAQSPDGRGWAYYVGLRDRKRYRWHTDPECCPSRGARGLAQIPTHVFGVSDEGLTVNFYEAAEATLTLPSGLKLDIRQETDYPFDGVVHLTLRPEEETPISLRLRVPRWCREWRLSVNGVPQDAPTGQGGYLAIARVWRPGDVVEFELEMPARVIFDEFGNNGRAAVMRGPLVYATDSSRLSPDSSVDDVVLQLDREDPARSIQVVVDEGRRARRLAAPSVAMRPPRGKEAWRDEERYHDLVGRGLESLESVELVPFFEAGNDDPDCYLDGVFSNEEPPSGVTYQVWLPYVWS